MFMPKLGTMHRRNSLPIWISTGIVFVVVAGLVFSGPARAQTSPSQAPQTQPPPPAQDPSAQTPPAPADQPPNGGQATSPQTPPPAGQAPAATPPAGQAPSAGQLPSATDNGVFVFRKEVDEVTL